MHGWRIKGRWTGGGGTAEADFVVLTSTREREEILAASMQHLVNEALRLQPGLTGKVSVELVDDPEELPQIAGLSTPIRAGGG